MIPNVSDFLTLSSTSKERLKIDPDKVEQKDLDDGIIEEVLYDYPQDYEYLYPQGTMKGDFVKKQQRLFFEDLELTDLVEGKLGFDENFINYTPKDYTWVCLKEGMIGYRSERIYYIRINVNSNSKGGLINVECKFKDVIPLNFALGKLDLSIKDIYE